MDREMLTSEEFFKLLAAMDTLRELAFKYGDRGLFPQSSSNPYDLVNYFHKLQVMDHETEPEVLLELGRFIARLRRQLNVRHRQWPHVKRCIKLCDMILAIAPNDGH